MIGQTLSQFRITAKLGEGGMGEVYRAEDTNLKRDVAIKVLPDAFVQDPERYARFEREAHVLASLNHPHIAAIHDLSEDQGHHFLVLELVDGEDLASRLARGPVPLDEALALAKQIAEALEAAHEKGIVHRDLKPANVMIGADDTVKVLDFGLAKAWEDGESTNADLTRSPTLTAQMTQAGIILGTAAYMAPEQARGQEADQRADIWSFGVVLSEMLTGERLFSAETVSDTLARVLIADPDWETIEGRVPTPVAALLHRCLERDKKQRLQAIGEARIAIEAYQRDPADEEAAAAVLPASEAGASGRAGSWKLAAALVIGALAATGVWKLLPSPPTEARTTIRSSLTPPPEVSFVAAGSGNLTLSSDGEWLAFLGIEGDEQVLYRRALKRFESEKVPFIKDAYNPVFSPDGQWLAYFADDKLYKIPMDGGPPHPLAQIDNQVWGVDWGVDGSIVFNGLYSGLWRVPEVGGEPELLAAPEAARGEIDLEFPHFLPDGNALLYTAFRGLLPDSAEIGILDLQTGERRTLIENASYARYLSSGHLIFGRSAGVFLVPFDTERRELTGAPVPAPEAIHYDRNMGVPHLAVSDMGDLVFLPAKQTEGRRLVSLDLTGAASTLFETKRNYMYPDHSPDGRILVTSIFDESGSHLWTANLSTGTLTQLTREGSNMFPLWSPDGQQIAFYSDRPEGRGIYLVPADGSGEAELLVPLQDVTGSISPSSWTPDSEILIYGLDVEDPSVEDGRSAALWALDVSAGADPERLWNGCCGELSPDGRWLAYLERVGDEYQVFVRQLEGGSGRQQISTGKDVEHPMWSPDGRQLLYAAENKIMAVALDTSDGLVAEAPRTLFEVEEGRFAQGTYLARQNHSLAPDGKSIVVIEAEKGSARAPEARLVLNWLDEVRRSAGQ